MGSPTTELSLEILEGIGVLSNCYILLAAPTKEAIIIDPSAEPQQIFQVIEKVQYSVKYLLNTHGHFDHIKYNGAIKKRFGAPLYIHQLDEEMLSSPEKNFSSFWGDPVVSPAADFFLVDGQKLKFSNWEIEVIHTPGHTPGGVSFLIKDWLFTGDTLFAGGVGRIDLPDSSAASMEDSLSRLLRLDPSLQIYPGHGPPTTIAEERQNFPPGFFT